MNRAHKIAGLFLILAWSATSAAQSPDARIDSMLVRVRAHINAGNLTPAKLLVDSALDAATAGTPVYGDALYWRSMAGGPAADVRRDLVRIAVEYSQSPTFPSALMKLAEIERASGDRASARRRLERIVRDHMDSDVGTRAALSLGEQLLADGAVAEACTALDSARTHVDGTQVELANRIGYTSRQCEQRLAAMTPPAPAAQPPKAPNDSAARGKPAPAARGGTGRAGTAARGRTPPVVSKGPWSVQVAAYKVRGDALRLEARLKARGYDVRIFGTDPYRVRVGKFATRAEAATVVARLRGDGHASIVVDDERP